MTREEIKNEFLAIHAERQERDRDLYVKAQLALLYIEERQYREALQEFNNEFNNH